MVKYLSVGTLYTCDYLRCGAIRPGWNCYISIIISVALVSGFWPLEANFTLKGCTHRATNALQLQIASKGFVDLWVHSFFAIFAIFDLKRQLKLLEMAFDQVQT